MDKKIVFSAYTSGHSGTELLMKTLYKDTFVRHIIMYFTNFFEIKFIKTLMRIPTDIEAA